MCTSKAASLPFPAIPWLSLPFPATPCLSVPCPAKAKAHLAVKGVSADGFSAHRLAAEAEAWRHVDRPARAAQGGRVRGGGGEVEEKADKYQVIAR